MFFFLFLETKHKDYAIGDKGILIFNILMHLLIIVFTVKFRLPNGVTGAATVMRKIGRGVCHGNQLSDNEVYVAITDISMITEHPEHKYDIQKDTFAALKLDYIM